LRVFENKVLRMFGPKREEMAGCWRRLHNEELHDLYTLLNVTMVIKSMTVRRMGYVACMEEMRNAYKILVGRHEGKRPLGRHRRTWNDTIRMVLGEYG